MMMQPRKLKRSTRRFARPNSRRYLAHLMQMRRQDRAADPLTALIDSLYGDGQQGAMYIPQPVVLGSQALYQDAAGTDPVTADGDPVGLMKDQSGRGNDASQATSGSKPIYRTDGVKHWLEYDGFDDGLRSPTLTHSPGKVAQFIAGYTSVGSTADTIQFIINSNSTMAGSVWIEARTNEDRAQYYNNGALVAPSEAGLAFPRTAVISGLFSHDAPYAKLRRNGVEVDSSTAGVTTGSFADSPLAIGVQESAASRVLNGNMYAAIAVFDSENDEGTIRQVEDYIAKLTGVTL